jgi:DNA-binding response OmpR family regulator
MRVLVADDDQPMSQLLCAMLRKAGHQPVQAFDGASTLMAAMRQPAPDVIVLDLQMPAGDGQTTLTKLKQSTKTALIPVIIVSGTKDPDAATKVTLLGAASFLEKPVDPETFIAAVEFAGAYLKK